MEIRGIDFEAKALKSNEINKNESDGLKDRSAVLEMPCIDGNDNGFVSYGIDDSERERMELPYINNDIEEKQVYSPLLTSIIKENEEMYAPSMEIQAEKIEKVFDVIPELHYDKWKLLDIDERKRMLNNFEKEIAAIEKRPPMPVEYEQTSKGVMGYNDGRKLVISERILGSNSFSNYKETLNTLFHEGRHSYQNYNLYVKRTERSEEVYNSWFVNREKLGYSPADVSFPFNLSEDFRKKSYYKYYTQPVEVDARLFAETVENKILV